MDSNTIPHEEGIFTMDTPHDDLGGTIEHGDHDFLDGDDGGLLADSDLSEVVPSTALIGGDSPYNHDMNHPTQAARFDQGKARIELVDMSILPAIGRIAAFGAKKYSDNNWYKGFPWLQPFASLMRHLVEWQKGNDFDPESQLPHLDHAAWNIHALIAFRERGLGTDNRFRQQPPEPPIVTVARVDWEEGERFEVAVQLPMQDTAEGLGWFVQGTWRPSLEQAEAVAQALRTDGYVLRVVRIRSVQKGTEVMTDGTTRTIHRFKVVRTIFPGDTLPTPG